MRKSIDNGPGLSFFSFQDIITSVTGIMFLVVILIILLIFEQKATTGAQETPERKAQTATTKADLDALSKKVEALRKSLKDSREWLKRNSALAEELMKLDLQEIERRVEALRNERAELAKAIQELSRLTDQSTQELKEIKNSEQDIKIRTEKLATQDKAKENELSALNSTLNQLKDAVSKQKRVTVSFDRTESKTPIKVECGKDGLRAQVCGSEEVHDFRTPDTIHHAASLNKFMEWAKTVDGNSFYFVLCVCPSAFGYVGDLSLKLKEAGKERGIEILPDDKSTLF